MLHSSEPTAVSYCPAMTSKAHWHGPLPLPGAEAGAEASEVAGAVGSLWALT